MPVMRTRVVTGAALLLIVLIAGVYALGGTGRRRQEMVEQCKSLRIGMSQAEIFEVLGKPTRGEDDARHADTGKNVLFTLDNAARFFRTTDIR